MENETVKLPERLERTTIYESDYVCLYTDKVKLPSGDIIEKYHQIHYPHGTVLNEAMNHNNYMDAWYNIPDKDWETALNKLGID